MWMVLEPGMEMLLRQEAASTELTPSELAAVLVGSALLVSLDR